ncbi:MAG TPA: class I SAM-dependent methyltransferase [Bryobacteraceae bacterium]|jgi:2-polyprenyl-3-methyl-5-hydroxy-6-metoxy-1,4-benzoquinol methylase|nr:class I SAM-dependent methyltransferase [Bryobacteraceae bacterium]
MPKLSAQKATLPDYALFRSVCSNGLSKIRPLRNGASRKDDAWGWNYGSGWPPSYWAYGRMRAMLTLLEASALKPRTVLEVAAGDAALSACLTTMGCSAAANDLRAENLANAVANFTNSESIRCLPGNLFDLDPREIGQFDLVIACEIVEHVAHTVDFLQQLRRFIAPGGHILLTTPNGAYFRNKLPTHSEIEDFAALEQQQFKPDSDGHLFLITPREMESLARQAGLKIERLVLWATPLVTGHIRLAMLSNPVFCWACYQLERLFQNLPFSIKERACFNFSAVLTAR